MFLGGTQGRLVLGEILGWWLALFCERLGSMVVIITAGTGTARQLPNASCECAPGCDEARVVPGAPEPKAD